MRIGEIETHEWGDLPGKAHGCPESVIVRQTWRANLVGDGRDFVTDTAAHRQPFVPTILGAGREEPAIIVLERNLKGVGAYQRRSAVQLINGDRADPAPVGPFHGTHDRPLRVYLLADTERNDIGKLERRFDRTRCRERNVESRSRRKEQGSLDVLIDGRAPTKADQRRWRRRQGNARRGTEAVAATSEGELLTKRRQSGSKFSFHVLELDARADADPVIDPISDAGGRVVSSDRTVAGIIPAGPGIGEADG